MNPSEFVLSFVDRIKPGGEVLDLACGSGRHTRSLLARGFSVTAVDIDLSGVEDLRGHPRCRLWAQNLEDGSAWPWKQAFDAIVVTRYLYRPILQRLPDLLADRGILIYETFMVGNERYNKPRNPDFLLKEDELESVFEPYLDLIAFEQVYTDVPKPSVVQRYCGRRPHVSPAGDQTGYKSRKL